MRHILRNFWQEDDYITWLDKIQNSPAINILQWDNVQNFLNLSSSREILIKQITKTISLKQFIAIVKEYGYSFTEQELAWVMINQEIIWGFLAIAEKYPDLKAKLLSTTTPQNFLEIARQHNYIFPIEAFIWILIDIKSSSRVRISIATGEAYVTPVISMIPTGQWIWLAEEWGMLAPFSHVKKPEMGFFKSGDIDDEEYFLRQCFLPHGYFNQRLLN
ncbi:MAG: Nif11-like leader peptide family natural product precursor [Sphaerospermopsis kisseleviana]